MFVKNKILIIDDSKMNLKILNEIFEKEYEVYLSQGAFKGIELASEKQPDLILLDIIMPEIDGFEVIKKLKSNKATQKIPIIFITGVNDVKQEEKGLTLGAIDFITKPFNPISIKARVKNHIQIKSYRDMLESRLDMNVQSLQEAVKQNIELDYLLKEAGEIAKIGFYIYYINEDIFYWSPEMYKLLNINKNEIPDSNDVGNRLSWFLQQVEEQDRSKVLSIIDENLAIKEGFDIQFKMAEKNKHFRSLFKYVTDKKLNSKKVIGVIQDITEFKQHEIELLNAKKDAEEANNLKTELLRNLGHELRTPLNGVLGMLDLSIMTDIPDKIKDNLNLAKMSTLRLAELINEIIEFSKITSKDIQLDNFPFVFKNFFHMLMNNFKTSIAQKDLKLVYDYNVLENLIIHCDPKYLEKLFIKLLDNSIKFTKKGSIEIHAKIISKLEDKYTCHFKIIDTGIGIVDSKIKNIFDPFYQGESDYSRNYEGIGLGLAFTKKIVELMNGKIWYETNYPNGSIFHVILPLKVKVIN